MNSLPRTPGRISFCVLLTLLLAACVQTPLTPGAGTPQATLSPTTPPTPAPPQATPEPTSTVPPTPSPTSTTVPANQLPGTWHHVVPADGLCTDSPQLVGQAYIGAPDSATLCYPAAGAFVHPANGTSGWETMALPIGTRVTGAGTFPPGGGRLFALDAGLCTSVGPDQFSCQTPADGLPFTDIRAMTPLGTEAVYMLEDAVVYGWPDYTTVSIPAAVGHADARPAAIAGRQMSPEKEIWVGTNAYGILVLSRSTGETWQHTQDNGLPSNTVRDISTTGEYCTKGCPDLTDVWVATDQGVAHWNGTAWQTYTAADGLPSSDAYAVSSGQPGTVWALTTGGPAYFDGQTWQTISLPEGLGMPLELLRDVAAGPGEVWIATEGAGLMIYVIE